MICILRNVITLQIIRGNEIPRKTACSKLQVPKIKYGYQINKTGSISKIKMTSDIFLIRGILRTMKYSNVGRYLDPCETYCKVFGKKFQAIIMFAGRSLLDRFLHVLHDSKCAYVSINASYQHIQTYSSILQEHTHAYSEP